MNLFRGVWITVIFSSLIVNKAGGQVCPSKGGLHGVDISWDPATDNEISTSYVTLADTYILTNETINCEGVVTAWQFVLRTCMDAWFLVFDAANTIIGQNHMTKAECETLGHGEVIFGVIPGERIHVMQGYHIGFKLSNTSDSPIVVQETTFQHMDPSFNEAKCPSTSPGTACTLGANANLTFLVQAVVNEAPPPFIHNLDATVAVPENSVGFIYTVIGSHPSNDVEHSITIPDPIVLVYSHPTPPPKEFAFFDNGDGTMSVTVTTPLDHEKTAIHLIPVTLTGLSRNVTANLTIYVTDVNELHYLYNDSEDIDVTGPNAHNCATVPVHIIKVNDTDDPANFPRKTFHIKSITPSGDPHAPFVIDPDTGAVNCTPDLDFLTWLDSDPLSYNLLITANDGTHYAECTLTINIRKAYIAPFTDNLPLGTPQYLPEDTAVGSYVFTVIGDGPDLTSIRLSIEDVQPRAFYEHFSIDPLSGKIELLKPLDYLSTGGDFVYVLVGIEDALQKGISQNCTFNVTWVNTPPSFEFPVYEVSIPEECNYICNETDPAKAWEIPNLHFNIIDFDVDNGLPYYNPDNLRCRILHKKSKGAVTPPDADYFQFTAGSGCSKLLVEKRVDVDLYNHSLTVELILQVQDKAGEDTNVWDSATVIVHVYELNDNYPEFDLGSYYSFVEENSPEGTSVLTVHASDIDFGNNADVRYTLGNMVDNKGNIMYQGTQHFQVDFKTGNITVKQPPDYEAYKTISFYAIASDRGEPQRVTMVPVTIDINNVNDEPPVWGYCKPRCWCITYRPAYLEKMIVDDPCFYNLEVRDDRDVDYNIITLKASDRDTNRWYRTYFTLQPDQYFELDQYSADIRVLNPLPAYVKSFMSCYVQDNGGPLRGVNYISNPPLYVRLDTYKPQRQLINIVMNVPMDQQMAEDFIELLYPVLEPWFPKLESLQKDNHTVTMYALEDASTYDMKNIRLQKFFVDRNQLLKVLRKNLKGTPKDILTGNPAFDPYEPILVEPTYPIWLIDTIPGIITLAMICLLLLAALLGLILGLCYRNQLCCFKKTPAADTEPLQRPPRAEDEVYDEMDDEKPEKDKDEEEEEPDQHRRKPDDSRPRRDSVDTIHSLIYDPRLVFA